MHLFGDMQKIFDEFGDGDYDATTYIAECFGVGIGFINQNGKVNTYTVVVGGVVLIIGYISAHCSGHGRAQVYVRRTF